VQLEGAKLLVVGGSAGIGREFGEQALRAGARVAFAARRVEVLEQIARASEDAYGVVVDVCDEMSVTHALAEAVEHLGGLDAVLHTAGSARLGLLADQGADAWREVLETNVMGPALVARAAVPLLAPGAGVMVFCSSTVEDQPRWGLSAYGVSKVALNRLVQCLRFEHEDLRFVRATIGSTAGTEFGDKFAPDILNEAFAQWIVRAQHTNEMMVVGDVASVLLDVVRTLLEKPRVHIPTVKIEPPGGALTLRPTPEVVAQAYASAPGPTTGAG
jgi:NAD(P)-dependent dehydrogenase (short-subunit alcohol dehydrogenase family)